MFEVGRFDGKRALVTGGGNGIGRATALLLAAEGASVVVADLDGAAAEQVAGEIGPAAQPHQVDVADAVAVAALAAAHPDVEVLISNAGWDRAMPFLETGPELWERIVAVNYKGHLAVAHAFVPRMIERGGGGRLVLVASDAGRVGSSGEAVYSGAKGGVIAFSKALAREVARHGIRVNCVAPGLTDTALLRGIEAANEKLVQAIVRTIPLGRVGRPEEVAQAIAFLASDDAAYITGQTLSVNGGLTMV